jgi:hypothetical protein
MVNNNKVKTNSAKSIIKPIDQYKFEQEFEITEEEKKIYNTLDNKEIILQSWSIKSQEVPVPTTDENYVPGLTKILYCKDPVDNIRAIGTEKDLYFLSLKLSFQLGWDITERKVITLTK